MLISLLLSKHAGATIRRAARFFCKARSDVEHLIALRGRCGDHLLDQMRKIGGSRGHSNRTSCQANQREAESSGGCGAPALVISQECPFCPILDPTYGSHELIESRVVEEKVVEVESIRAKGRSEQVLIQVECGEQQHVDAERSSVWNNRNQ